MTLREAEDYRYGYKHAAEVDGKTVSVRKASNCGGWIDLNTDELYSNESVEDAKVGKRIATD